jgi:single-strand DNA-binding protein
MRGVNKVILIGNLGRDPELQKLEGDISVGKFPLATSETFKDRNGNRAEQTEWHNIVAWRQLADFCGKYLHKGSFVYIEGKLRTTSWTDKDNNKKFRTEIIAEVISMLDRKTDNNNQSNISEPNNAVNTPASESIAGQTADDLPF